MTQLRFLLLLTVLGAILTAPPASSASLTAWSGAYVADAACQAETHLGVAMPVRCASLQVRRTEQPADGALPVGATPTPAAAWPAADPAIATRGAATAVSRGNWVSPKQWAKSHANDVLKAKKLSGVGKGARSGQHGIPYNRAATELEQAAKTGRVGGMEVLPEIRTELSNLAGQFRQRARELNHGM